MARVAKRLKRQGADDRGALQEIKGMLHRHGYSGMSRPGEIVEALEHLLESRNAADGIDASAPPTLAAPAPTLLASPAIPVAVDATRALFGLPPTQPAAAPFRAPALCVPSFRSLSQPAPMASPMPAPAPIAAPAAMPAATAASAQGPDRSAPLDIAAFNAKFKDSAEQKAAANLAEANGGPRPKAAASAGARFANGRTGVKPSVEDQYKILERITGKHAEPAPPSGIVNAMAR